MTREESNALTVIAQRINPSCERWWSPCNNGEFNEPFPYRCFICNDIVSGSGPMVDHGIKHLKEKGLLVFL